ncbi:MAG: NADH-quinone oxidoreductase subunit D [Chloroflexi bacterium]|nr:NADH-quinone oxidoreductase subunit D [Chloroflexota bacterium]
MAINRQLDTLDMMLNMGPQHPATHGVFRMVLWIDGERIVDVEPHIGYLHLGTEKLCEGEQYSQIITLFDRLDYVANFNNELVICAAAEKLMGLEVPERALYIRTILCELNRIASHMLFYGTFALDAGAMTPVLYAFKERERIQSLFEAVSGARMMHNYFRIGGVKQDLPEDFYDRMGRLLDPVKRTIEEADDLVTFNEIFLARTRDVGAIDGKTALGLGLTGPNLRATGVDYDLRKAEPYLLYDRLDFSVPLGDRGDCWDRFWVRIREMEESVRLVEQCLQQMQPGPVMAPIRRISRPPKGEVFAHAENPRGDLGVYLVSSGADRPYRVKIRPPSFCNLMSLKHMMRNAYVADAVLILGSIDIVLGEVDR